MGILQSRGSTKGTHPRLELGKLSRSIHIYNTGITFCLSRVTVAVIRLVFGTGSAKEGSLNDLSRVGGVRLDTSPSLGVAKKWAESRKNTPPGDRTPILLSIPSIRLAIARVKLIVRASCTVYPVNLRDRYIESVR